MSIDGVELVSQVARFSELKEKSVLHTGLGRAEIMLTPGTFLRVHTPDKSGAFVATAC